MATVYGAEGNNEKKKEFILQGLFIMCGSVISCFCSENSFKITQFEKLIL
jgi:hypothetical protein